MLLIPENGFNGRGVTLFERGFNAQTQPVTTNSSDGDRPAVRLHIRVCPCALIERLYGLGSPISTDSSVSSLRPVLGVLVRWSSGTV